ncbi:uncharacterized mitochondrial protein AtMg00810-like [Carya illinoinensis]|uniref:uncharacterized mitochondrial protein AtMg00810-like n=1 Tax=Carya illinoinensis TaxID=32201 RepID=UPI001C719FDB|nr:uncharacterized mitochondrial protein AtMg00810-like [Carya illinoinensis]
MVNRTLYGLKQAPRAWFDKLSDFLLQLGFFSSLADPSLFICHSNHGVLILILYVDDMVVTGDNPQRIQWLISQLSTQFSMKDLGFLHHFLGIEVHKIGTDLFLNQHRPDLSSSVNYVCQFLQAPIVANFQLVKRILRYLQGTVELGLRITSDSSLDLYGFSDANWAGCPTTRRSTSGYCTFLGSNCISWSAKKQPTVARSSAEAKYKAMASTAAELTWISTLL